MTRLEIAALILAAITSKPTATPETREEDIEAALARADLLLKRIAESSESK